MPRIAGGLGGTRHCCLCRERAARRKLIPPAPRRIKNPTENLERGKTDGANHSRESKNPPGPGRGPVDRGRYRPGKPRTAWRTGNSGHRHDDGRQQAADPLAARPRPHGLTAAGRPHKGNPAEAGLKSQANELRGSWSPFQRSMPRPPRRFRSRRNISCRFPWPRKRDRAAPTAQQRKGIWLPSHCFAISTASVSYGDAHDGKLG